MAFSGILAVNSGGEKRIKGGGGVNRRLTADFFLSHPNYTNHPPPPTPASQATSPVAHVPFFFYTPMEINSTAIIDSYFFYIFIVCLNFIIKYKFFFSSSHCLSLI